MSGPSAGADASASACLPGGSESCGGAPPGAWAGGATATGLPSALQRPVSPPAAPPGKRRPDRPRGGRPTLRPSRSPGRRCGPPGELARAVPAAHGGVAAARRRVRLPSRSQNGRRTTPGYRHAGAQKHLDGIHGPPIDAHAVRLPRLLVWPAQDVQRVLQLPPNSLLVHLIPDTLLKKSVLFFWGRSGDLKLWGAP